MRKQTEKDFQVSVVQRLSIEQRVPFIHPYYPRSLLEGKRAKRMGMAAGWPDLLFPAPGSLCLELKAPGGQQSQTQKSMQLELESYGLVYEVVRNYDAAIEAIKRHCIWGYQ